MADWNEYRDIARHFAESKLDVSIGSFLSEIKDSRGRVRGKIVGIREYGEDQENMFH